MSLIRVRLMALRPVRRYSLQTLATVALSLSMGATSTLADAPLTKRVDATPLKPPMAVNWKYSSIPFSFNPAAPVVADGTLYYASGLRLHAIDPTTGREKWRYPQDNFLATPVLATPTVSNGAIYFSAGDGLYALDAVTGKQKWPSYSVRSGVVTTPVIIGSNLYFGGGDRKLYAIDVEKGEPAGGIWSQGRRIGIDAGGDFAGDIATNGDLLYYVTNDGALRALNLTTGLAKWAKKVNTTSPNMTPILSGEYVYVAAGDTVYGFRAATGLPQGNVRLFADSTAPPVIDADGNIFVVNSDRFIVAVTNRGRPLWKNYPRVEHEVLVAPIIVGDSLIVGTAVGGIFAFDHATGKLLWNYNIQPSSLRADTIPTVANISAQPVLYNGSLFVLTDDGAMTSFRADAADGLPPVVTPITPEQGDYLKGTPPFYIAAKLVDEGSGIDFSTLSLKVDDKPIPRRPLNDATGERPGYVIETDTGYLEYAILEGDGGRTVTLANGHHNITLTVKDWMGNTTTKTWSFAVDDSLTKRSRRPGSTPTNGTQTNPGGRPGGTNGGGGRPGGGGKSGGGGGRPGGAGGRPGGGGGGAGSGD